MLIKRVPGFLVAEFQGVLLPLQMPYDFFFPNDPWPSLIYFSVIFPALLSGSYSRTHPQKFYSRSIWNTGASCISVSQTIMYIGITGGLDKMQILEQNVQGGAGESAFFTSSREMLGRWS